MSLSRDQIKLTMDTDSTDFARLSLLVQRLLDAEVLSEEEGAALLQTSHAARHALAQGHADEALAQLQQLARRIETLLARKALTLADGQAILQAVHSILNPETHTGA